MERGDAVIAIVQAPGFSLPRYRSLLLYRRVSVQTPQHKGLRMKYSDLCGRIVGSSWLRVAGIVCVLLIVFLSLVPGGWQERTALPGPIEHFIAYCGTAIVLSLATRRRYPPTRFVAGLAALAASLEILQYWSPGRDPEFIGFFASAAGALVGSSCAYWMRPARHS